MVRLTLTINPERSRRINSNKRSVNIPYQYIEDIAIGDVAFKAEARSLEDLFIQAACATMNVIVEDLGLISKQECRIINIESEAIDMLLFKLLEELIYFKDAEALLLLISKISINEENKKYLLHVESYGEKINPLKHKLGVDVKAVTLYRFKVEKNPSGWNATVVLDI